MNEAIREHIIKSLDKNVRIDGRTLEQYREVTIETGISATAEGSAQVRIGKTCVMAGVKLSVEKPYPDSPKQGNLMVTAELLPLSSPEFEQGPPSIKAIELARVIDRGIRESGTIDVKKLCIEEGEKVWTVIIDICTINHDGNLFDAAHLAAMAALQNAVYPTITEDGAVDYKNRTKKKLQLDKVPISVTIHKIGDNIVLDPRPQEEDSADGRLTVCSLEDGTVSALQKGGTRPFSLEEVDAMVSLALKQAKASRKMLS